MITRCYHHRDNRHWARIAGVLINPDNQDRPAIPTLGTRERTLYGSKDVVGLLEREVKYSPTGRKHPQGEYCAPCRLSLERVAVV